MENCSSHTKEYVYYSAYLSLFSSCLSIFGSALIILTFILWKDVRQSVARIILLFLALADLGTGLGYLISSAGFIIYYHHSNNSNETTEHYHDSNKTSLFHHFCAGTSFVTTFFPVTSFFWTTYLAIYFFVTLVLIKPGWGRKLLIIFNLTAWPIPLLICIIAASFGVLGESQYRSGGSWCFIALQGYPKEHRFNYRYPTFLLLEAGMYYIWEFLLLIIVIACYTAIFCVNRKCCQGSRHKGNTHLLHKAISKIDWKLFFIPLMFIIIRIPGAYRYFLSMAPSCHYSPNSPCHGSISSECFKLGGNYYILFIQAFLDPIQGFGNAVLFVFLSKVIVSRFIKKCCNYHFIRYYIYDEDEDEERGLLATTSALPYSSSSPSINKEGTDYYHVKYNSSKSSPGKITEKGGGMNYN